MDDTFKPDGYGKANNIGKLVFGKNSDGSAQEWYILGRDIDAGGDNTAIFADRPIAEKIQFYSSTENREGNGNPIYPNNYLHSDLDEKLQYIAYNENYFSHYELLLMKDTEIKTETETVRRRLYALQGAHTRKSDSIFAGWNSSIRIPIAIYCSNAGNREFWLRSVTDVDKTEPEIYQNASFVNTYNKMVQGAKPVTTELDVWPAANLNLSNVLFASSYDGKDESNRNGLILRLDGKNKNIGSVTFNRWTNTITAVRGTTSGNVRLVVQYGKNANKRGIFRDPVVRGTQTETWQSAKIFGNVDILEDDWSNCKIWLEMEENGMIYAVEATEDTTKPATIGSTYAIFDSPEGGKTLSTSVTTGENVVAEITWTDSNGLQVGAGAKADYYPAEYTAHITFTPAAGYMFARPTTLNVNGLSLKENPFNGKITTEITYPSSKNKLKSITAPASITVANGTAYEDMNLPAQVDIVTEGDTVNKADVAWNTSSPVNGNYDPAVLTEQTVTLQGTVTCPVNIDANGVVLTTDITITISAAEDKHTVEAPIADPEAGIYTENQTVTLKSATEGAVIYYTTNGVEPSSTTGTQYTGPITATGTKGQSVETNIKAIAVKSGMQDSLVMTYKYTIELPSQTPEIKAPVITSQPQDVTVKDGETATFTVVADGKDLTYQWQRDKGRGEGFKDYEGQNRASCITGNVGESCNGFQYRCIVSNSAGSVTSDSATLTVEDDTTPPSETTYIITATAGENGSISPSGSVEVKEGADQTFTITADEGYEIENLKVDGSEVSAASSYTFNNVTEAHRIEATFKQKVTNPDPGQPENPDPGQPENPNPGKPENPDPNPAEKPKPEVKKDEAPASSQAPQHEHSFNWVTVQTASAAQDGLEELRCSCGIVKERSVVPASQAYVNELYQNLSKALAEGEVSFDSGRIYTISDYLIRKLQERADVTTTITFEYNQDKYRMMIPAGVDYSELLADEDYFYGYFYFAKKVGARVESL